MFSYGWAGPLLGTAMLCLLFGLVPGLLTALTHGVLYVFVLAPLINGLGHWRGTQNFSNTAYNASLLAWMTAGESLHNNHHAHPRSAKFSMQRVEVDPSWLVIRVLAAVGLVVVTGTPCSRCRIVGSNAEACRSRPPGLAESGFRRDEKPARRPPRAPVGIVLRRAETGQPRMLFGVAI